MFKGLRDRLKGVADQLEDSLEAQLEAELEAELAAELGTQAPAPETEAAPSAPAAVPEPEPEPTPEAVPEPVEPEPLAEPAEEEAPVAEDPVIEAPVIEPAPEPQPPTPEPTPATAATPVVEPAPAPPQPETAPAPKPAAPITGRKVLEEDEIEARLAKELAEAVEVQKTVEETVAESGTKTRYSINEEVLDDVLWELEIGLLESDVALPVIEAIKESVKDQLLSMQVGGKSPADVVEKVLRAAIRRVLDVQTVDFDAFIETRRAEKTPVVIMFVGVNGTGKTTSIARMAYRLQQSGRSSVLAAGDTFRAGAIEQLTQHADKLGVKIIKHGPGADPAAVAYDAIEHAKARHKDVVLLDTAGRMQTNTNLMDEMDKIRRVANPDMVVFVGDSLAGNDAVEQARRFDEVVDIDGVILTKTDVDAKGGAALSVAYTINKPLLFIGVGQDYADLEPFRADVMVDRLFGE